LESDFSFEGRKEAPTKDAVHLFILQKKKKLIRHRKKEVLGGR